jgi:prepilin-type N-terminal cleavage/methylation domain-containing protein
MNRMKNEGFTLIEVILVVVIMAIAIPGLITVLSVITQGQVNTVGTTTAALLAQERLEEIVADKRSPNRGYAFVVNGNYAPDVPMAGYNRSVNIVCVAATDLNTAVPCDTGYKRVAVTVQAAGVGPTVPDAVLVTVLTDY